jgi:hypothetical protein
MPSQEERMVILRMIEEGKITPEEGARLLAAIGERSESNAAPPPPPAAALPNGRYLHVRVTNMQTGKQKVTVNVPLSIVEMGLRFVPQNDKFDPQTIRDAIRTGLTGPIVDVIDEEKGDRVEVTIG